MADPTGNATPLGGPLGPLAPVGAGFADIVTNQINLVRNVALLVQTIQNVLPRVTGSFTCANAVTTTVTEPNVTANSFIDFRNPTNAAAATLLGSAKSL